MNTETENQTTEANNMDLAGLNWNLTLPHANIHQDPTFTHMWKLFTETTQAVTYSCSPRVTFKESSYIQK